MNMRKGETIQDYEARAKAEAELPGQLASLTGRVMAMKASVRAMTTALKERNTPNHGGERSGSLSQ